MTSILDITDEYARDCKQMTGTLRFEEHYERISHCEEIETAKWIFRTFGGNILLLKENEKQGAKTPDYMWNGKMWERKGIHSTKWNTIDVRIRKAYSQIDTLRGGMILEFSDSKLTLEQAENAVRKSVQKRARGTVDIIIKKKEAYKILRVKK